MQFASALVEYLIAGIIVVFSVITYAITTGLTTDQA
jgi:hypothetical protein